LLTLQLRMKATSSLTTAAVKLEIKTEWVVDRYAMRELCFPCVVLSRFRHFGDIIALHRTLIMCSSPVSDSRTCAGRRHDKGVKHDLAFT
jgi:hypothetical protein